MVSREQKVEQSVQEYLKTQLFEVAGYDEAQVELLDSWDGTELPTPLEKTFIATGYGFDDGGRAGEMGSDLIFRVYTIEFIIFGLTNTWGKNLASVIQQAIESQGTLPLLDIGEPGQPEIDRLVVDSVKAERAAVGLNPPAWAKFIYSVHVTTNDEYFARLTG